MKNLIPVYLFLVLLFTQCTLEEIADVQPDPCDDSTIALAEKECACDNHENPSCPCPNEFNPDCSSPVDECTPPTFAIDLLEIGVCNDIFVDDATALPNGEGYLIVGRCFDGGLPSGLIIQVDTLGNVICKEGGHREDPGENDFFSIVATDNNEVFITGYTDNQPTSFNANVLLFEAFNGCDEDRAGTLDSGFPASPGQQTWDHGASIMEDPNDPNHLVISGKWEGYPAAFKVRKNWNNTDPQELVQLVPSMFSQDLVADALTGNPLPGHELISVFPTSDNGLIGVGWVDINDAPDRKRKPFAVKISANYSVEWLRTYSSDTDNIFGKKHAQAMDVIVIGNDIIMVGFGFDELPASGDPNDLPPGSFEGFIFQLNINNGNPEDYAAIASNDSQVNSIVRLEEQSGYVITGGIQENSFTKSVFIKGFTHEDGGLITPDAIIDNVFFIAGMKAGGKTILQVDCGFFILANMTSELGTVEGMYLVRTNEVGKVE